MTKKTDFLGLLQDEEFVRLVMETSNPKELLDELILMEIYPARELPIQGITSAWLLEKVNLNIKSLMATDDLLFRLKQNKPDVLLTMGAGDIDLLVKPIEQILTQQKEESHA